MLIIKTPSTIAFNIFGLPIYWYGIFMAIAIFTAILVGNLFFNKNNLDKYQDKIIENAPLIIFSGILGARLYYCCLNFSYYFAAPIEILNIRQGGLSIHGALLGGILSLLFVAKRNNISVLRFLDAISVSTILGQAIGRWGNYFNSEAYGLPVKSQEWGLLIPKSHRLAEFADIGLYHPTFLYESVLDVFGFGVLTYIYFKFAKFNGITFCSYLVIYSIIRFFVERIRIDSALNIGTIPIAEIVSVVMFIIGVLGLTGIAVSKHFKKF